MRYGLGASVCSLYGLVRWTHRHQGHDGTEVDYDYEDDDDDNDGDDDDDDYDDAVMFTTMAKRLGK